MTERFNAWEGPWRKHVVEGTVAEIYKAHDKAAVEFAKAAEEMAEAIAEMNRQHSAIMVRWSNAAARASADG